MTAGEAVRDAAARLGGGDDARRDARVLLRGLLGVDGGWLLAHATDPLASEDVARFSAAVERRGTGEPVAYVLGEAWFYGLRLSVTPATLVPRPETEALVELAARERPASVCDVGTGSGAIAIALATALPGARVVAIDVSPAALAVAARNVAAHGLRARVELRHGDLLGALRPDERFEAVVANLPYVPTGQLAAAPDPTSFEPRLALDGGADGLDAYRRLLRALPAHLTAPGCALFEAAPPTARPLAALARAAFSDASVDVFADDAGLDRVVIVRR